MTAGAPVDAEDALRRDLASASGADVFAPPVPSDLDARAPCAMVERDGGVRINEVMDSHNVTVSVWAGTWAEAMREAGDLAGALARLPSFGGASVQWRTAQLTALPFNATDPAHPDIPRVQFAATATCRATI